MMGGVCEVLRMFARTRCQLESERWLGETSGVGMVYGSSANVNVAQATSTATAVPPPLSPHTMLVSLTVGKVDAGVAVLLTEDKRLVRPL